MHYKILMVGLLLAIAGGGCDRAANQDPSKIQVTLPMQALVLPMEERRTISCKTPDVFAQRTAILSVDTTVVTKFEEGFDEKHNKPTRYAYSIESVSAQAISSGGLAIPLPDLTPTEHLDQPQAKDICSGFNYLLAGPFGIITHFVQTGNPYPVEDTWFLHGPLRKLVESSEVLDRHGFLEQAGTECIDSIERGWASSPGQHDRWCAAGPGKLKWVRRLMVLDEKERLVRSKPDDEEATNYYWCRCDRTNGVGKVLEKAHVISLGQHEGVSDSEISRRMDQECEQWARESSKM